MRSRLPRYALSDAAVRLALGPGAAKGGWPLVLDDGETQRCDEVERLQAAGCPVTLIGPPP